MSAKKSSKGATKRKQPLQIKKWLFVIAGFVVFVFVIAVLGIGIKIVAKFDWQPMALQHVELESQLVYQNENDLNEVLAGFLTRSLLFLNLNMVQKEIEALPWVYEVSVMKNWPGELVISIEEHEPVAIWNDQRVLNSEGIPLEKPVAKMALARLVGPEGQAETVMKQYLQFTQVFDDLGIHIVEVTMHPRGAWDLKMENGISIALGDKNVLERSRRVVRVLNSDQYQRAKIEHIDARYPNGLAIRLTSEEAQEVKNDITT